MGPTTRTASMSRDVSDPGARQVTFDDLVAAYHEQARGAPRWRGRPPPARDGLRHPEPEGALFAIEKLFAERGQRVPVLASITFVQVGNDRMMTGQTVEACWNSIAHAPLLGVGINCSLGPATWARTSTSCSASRPCS
jgi:5-methyltetrahydrofolate--homocysteine methyltransferase